MICRTQADIAMATTSMKLILSVVLLLTVGFSLSLSAFSTGSDHEQFVYTGSNLTLDGAARITSSGLVELTNETFRIKGHAIHPAPLRFRRSPNGTVQSFSVSFVFGILSSFGDIRGHGFAFFISPSTDFSAAFPIQFLGLLNDTNNGSSSNHLFAVELDTIENDEFGDINNNHVGIDINSLNSLQSYRAGFYDDKKAKFTDLFLIGSGPIQAWVDYDGNATHINVTIAPLGMARPMRPLLSATYNLSEVLTDLAYLGFSSSTGLSTGHHCVLGWSFGMNSPAPIIDLTKLPKLSYLGPRPQSKLLKIVLPIASAVLVLAVGTAVVLLMRKKVLQVIVPIATATSVFVVGLAVFLFVRRRSRYAELQEDWEVEFGPHRFSFKDLFCATEGFKERHLLGRGGFGRVYKGVLPKSKSEIAVKRVSHESRQGIREFISEVVSIGRLRHRNIVQLLGYCRRKDELLLVYDYMPNGSLDKYLYAHSNRPGLDWIQRLRIIKGVASGLWYLHGEWEQVVIHRDVKASNVLLDGEMNARLGDFGLARLYDHGTDMQTTHLVGTIGYLAPELVQTGKASPLTDVFAFGIFVLEVTCGRRPIEHKMHSNQLVLVNWVLDLWREGALAGAMDSRLQNDYDVGEASLVLKLGLLCSHPSPSARPSMWHVMQYLKHDLPFPELSPMDMVQRERVESPVACYESVASNGTMSGLSGGR